MTQELDAFKEWMRNAITTLKTVEVLCRGDLTEYFDSGDDESSRSGQVNHAVIMSVENVYFKNNEVACLIGKIVKTEQTVLVPFYAKFHSIVVLSYYGVDVDIKIHSIKDFKQKDDQCPLPELVYRFSMDNDLYDQQSWIMAIADTEKKKIQMNALLQNFEPLIQS